MEDDADDDDEEERRTYPPKNDPIFPEQFLALLVISVFL
jgi:hypothetical protein